MYIRHNEQDIMVPVLLIENDGSGSLLYLVSVDNKVNLFGSIFYTEDALNDEVSPVVKDVTYVRPDFDLKAFMSAIDDYEPFKYNNSAYFVWVNDYYIKRGQYSIVYTGSNSDFLSLTKEEF